MPQPAPEARFEKEPSELAEEAAPIFSTTSRSQSNLRRGPTRDSFALGRVSTSQSQTHDMSTGTTREGAGRGFGFDEAPIAPVSIARYTSRTSEHSSIRTRPRKGSVRLAGVELNRASLLLDDLCSELS